MPPGVSQILGVNGMLTMNEEIAAPNRVERGPPVDFRAESEPVGVRKNWSLPTAKNGSISKC